MLLSAHRKRRAKLVFEQLPILVGRIVHPERNYGCCLVRATRAHYHVDVIYLFSLLGINNNNTGLMVLLVKPTLTRFPTNSLYAPVDNTPLHSIPSVCHQWVLLHRNASWKFYWRHVDDNCRQSIPEKDQVNAEWAVAPALVTSLLLAIDGSTIGKWKGTIKTL